MELMETSLDKFYKFVYREQQSSIPENILGKITVAVSSFSLLWWFWDVFACTLRVCVCVLKEGVSVFFVVLFGFVFFFMSVAAITDFIYMDLLDGKIGQHVMKTWKGRLVVCILALHFQFFSCGSQLSDHLQLCHCVVVCFTLRIKW